MKTIASIICSVLVSLGFTISADAQTTATASALLITPITIAKNVDMNFGNVAVSSVNSGTVILSPASIRSTGGGGGVTLPATTGSVSAADFTVSGQGSYNYSITLPSSASLSDGIGHTMTINAFTSSPSATGTLSSLGTQNLTVGATLNLVAAQTPGNYTNATAIPVTVNYY